MSWYWQHLAMHSMGRAMAHRSLLSSLAMMGSMWDCVKAEGMQMHQYWQDSTDVSLNGLAALDRLST